MKHRDFFRYSDQKITWGNLKIQLLDTTFWAQLSQHPDKFVQGFQSRVNLLKYDFVVMPMFEV